MAEPVPDLTFCRAEFPALNLQVAGQPAVFLDGPGGTQVPRRVIDRITHYLAYQNANEHGAFLTSQQTDLALQEAHGSIAAMLGCQADEVAFGQNMTTLNFTLARALGRHLGPGDEIIITRLDHEGNRGPWLALQEKGVTVRQVAFDHQSLTLNMEDLRDKLNDNTRVVAVGGASNATGTVNDIGRIVEWAHHVGALCVIDAVHLAPHKPIDVKALDCDFLLCSAYKFFGPHVGVLYGRRDVFETLETYKVLPQSNDIPFKLQTGTLNHEGIAGVTAAVEFIADLGRRVGNPRCYQGSETRRAVMAGMNAIDEYEQDLATWFVDQLHEIRGLRLYGPPPGHPRTPTFSFTMEHLDAPEIARVLGEQGIFAWDGDFYATTLVNDLGLAARGGVLRLGLAPYNTRSELERTLQAIAAL